MKKILFLLSLLFISLSFAKENYSLYSKILENEKYCMQGYFEGKAYLNNRCLFIEAGQILLDLNETESVFLPILYSDSRGPYLTSEIDSIFESDLVRCPICLQYYLIYKGHKCPGKPKK
jgi:hypothetical protein